MPRNKRLVSLQMINIVHDLVLRRTEIQLSPPTQRVSQLEKLLVIKLVKNQTIVEMKGESSTPFSS